MTESDRSKKYDTRAGYRQPLAARVWGPWYRTWFPPEVPRQRWRAKRRSAKRERMRARAISEDLRDEFFTDGTG